MKTLKLIAVMIMIMAVSLPLCVFGAAGDSPSQVVELDIEAFRNRIRENGIAEVFGLEQYMAAYSPEDMQLLSDKLCDFDYEILKEEVDGDTATVTVKLTTYEFGKALHKIIREVFIDGLFSVFSDSEGINEEEIAGLLRERLAGLEKKKHTEKVKIKCKKENGEWISDLDSNEQFLNEVFGGAVSVINKYNKYF